MIVEGQKSKVEGRDVLRCSVVIEELIFVQRITRIERIITGRIRAFIVFVTQGCAGYTQLVSSLMGVGSVAQFGQTQIQGS